MKVIIVGGGPSGLSCAITLARENYEVTILEKCPMLGKKIIASGAGRCNLSNEFINCKGYNHISFAKKVLSTFSNEDFVDFLQSVGIGVRYDHEGRMYPYSESSHDVLDALLLEARILGINIILNHQVKAISYQEEFDVDGYKADYLVVATGGKSVSAYGSTGDGYYFAKKFGHQITPLSPSLAPIHSNDPLIKGLAGLRVKCSLKIESFEEKGELLFKKDGISGIVTFNMVSYLNHHGIKNPTILVDFLTDYPKESFFQLLTNPKKKVSEAFIGIMDNRLSSKLIEISKVRKEWNKDLTLIEQQMLYETFKNAPIVCQEVFDFEQSQVTSGGICLTEIKETFESKLKPHLFFIGEIIDLDGICGGYNMHMAFASGVIAGRSIKNARNR